MDPIFTEEQLNRMSRDDMLSLVKIMQGHYQKQKEALEKQETRDPAPGRENKGTGIPERHALGPPYPCPEETLWSVQRKICGRVYPAGSFQRGRAGSGSQCPGTGPGRGPSVFLQEEETFRQKGERPFLL